MTIIASPPVLEPRPACAWPAPTALPARRRQFFQRTRRSQLHLAEALPEAQVAPAQRHLRIHAQVPAQVDDGKQQIAQLRFNGRLRAGLGIVRDAASASSSRVSSASLGSRSRQSGQSKPAFCAFPPSFAASASAGMARCTLSSRDAGFRCSTAFRMRSSAALISSQLRSTCGRRAPDLRINTAPRSQPPRSLFAKHMRMPPHQLAVQMIQHVGDREMAFVGRHLRIKQHLQQQIAQLLGQMRKVAPLNGVENLVGLFQRVFANGVERSARGPRGSRRARAAAP